MWLHADHFEACAGLDCARTILNGVSPGSHERDKWCLFAPFNGRTTASGTPSSLVSQAPRCPHDASNRHNSSNSKHASKSNVFPEKSSKKGLHASYHTQLSCIRKYLQVHHLCFSPETSAAVKVAKACPTSVSWHVPDKQSSQRCSDPHNPVHARVSICSQVLPRQDCSRHNATLGRLEL
jgi:hypothetical protein